MDRKELYRVNSEFDEVRDLLDETEICAGA